MTFVIQRSPDIPCLLQVYSYAIHLSVWAARRRPLDIRICCSASLSSMCHWMCVKTCGFSTMAHHLISACGSTSFAYKICANVDRSWWPDWLFCTFIRPDPAKLLHVGPHVQHGLLEPCVFRGRPSGACYDCGGYWTTRYWWSCVREHSI